MLVRRKRISSEVNRLLEEYEQSGPPVDIRRIAEVEGIKVVERPSPEADFSGFYLVEEGVPVIGINTASANKGRERFTLAHELAHHFLHEQQEGVPHVDRRFVVKFRNDESSKGEYIEEMEANLFAASLLMPEQFLRRSVSIFTTFDYDDDDLTSKLAEEYGVSKQAITIRLANLGLVRI